MGVKMMKIPEAPYLRFAGVLPDRERMIAYEAADVTCHFLEPDPAHPLFAARVSPLMKCRCSSAKTSSVGNAARMAPAAIRL